MTNRDSSTKTSGSSAAAKVFFQSDTCFTDCLIQLMIRSVH